MLDLPWIIKGASLGKGQGDEVLDFILKIKIILHIIDFGTSYKNPIKDFLEINSETRNYSNRISEIKQIVIANKMDIAEGVTKLKEFKLKFPNIKIISMSH